MFIVMLTAALALMHFYLWRRLIRGTSTPGWTRRALTLAFLVPTAALVVTIGSRVATVLSWAFGEDGLAWVERVGYIWLGLVFYLTLTLLVTEPVRWALRGWARRPVDGAAPAGASGGRRLLVNRATAAVAAVVSVAVVGVGISTAMGPPNLLTVPIRLQGLNPAFDGYRIAMVNDVHLGVFSNRAQTERIVAMVNDTDPDLVVIVGDLVDDTVGHLAPAAEPLRNLRSADGVYFVTGNHEYYVDDTPEWIDELSQLGVRTLANANTTIRRGDASFNLAGVTDIVGERLSQPPDFDRAMEGADDSVPTVLLAHQPVQVREAAEHGVDLQLSGHTHGGQMWPFHYAVLSQQPALAGLSTIDGVQLYISRGAGFWGPPVRVGAPPDVSLLVLQP
ncbi:metallophosphoesterase [Mycolicibacterium brumae]|uniref:Metallophosphoesterase n=1 Tax=Mycolicibacterium brumae TaxID=85968 RepID=A0A2G5PDH5_9MYCO|nr:metallophosphoesterase [Mycolicibacterium brumae]MCV7191744.1 metallophosphoesterase [Mycolicibacterium brumae]PIB76367.1 metallophosphoesterase [Mycolicibacterium brumae]RWA15882.1 hypothetical protein MBRU_10045 [Mycolicibacterium brumae DSM 44177]UWW07049.1 metallophosphoesterase [Mycolicibacterium brumae]